MEKTFPRRIYLVPVSTPFLFTSTIILVKVASFGNVNLNAENSCLIRETQSVQRKGRSTKHETIFRVFSPWKPRYMKHRSCLTQEEYPDRHHLRRYFLSWKRWCFGPYFEEDTLQSNIKTRMRENKSEWTSYEKDYVRNLSEVLSMRCFSSSSCSSKRRRGGACSTGRFEGQMILHLNLSDCPSPRFFTMAHP